MKDGLYVVALVLNSNSVKIAGQDACELFAEQHA